MQPALTPNNETHPFIMHFFTDLHKALFTNYNKAQIW